MGKQFILAAALCSAVFVSCNQMNRADQEAREHQPGTDTVTPGQRLDSALNRVERGAEQTSARIDDEAKKAEDAVARAKQDLSDAKARGDKKAELEAQKALDKASAIWDRTKKAADRAADATRDAADRAVNATRDAARKTGDAVDTSYQRASRKVNDVLHND